MLWRTVILLALTAPTWACVCSGGRPSVNQAWHEAPFVFVGTVELADPDLPDSQTQFEDQLVRILVDEPFKGVAKGQVIELHQGGSDCDAKFRTGEHFVFYLSMGGNPKEFAVPACTRALENAEAGSDDLLFLHGLPKSAIGTRLSGQIEHYENRPNNDFHRVGGVPNVTVWITASGQPPHQTVTNSAGAFEVYGLAPGDYSVHIDVPSGLTPFLGGPDSMAKLEQDAAETIDFTLMADTRLSGRVLDAKGSPRPDVCFDLESIEEPGRVEFGCSKTDGRFKITQMPAGKYRLVAYDEVGTRSAKSQSTLYYPGVRDLNQAGVITIEAGKYVDDLEVRIPTGEIRHQLSGKLQYSDGAPVAIARVTFTSPEHGYAETTETGEDGSFHLSVLAGMRGQLEGSAQVLDSTLTQCPQFRASPEQAGIVRFMETNSISLSPDSDDNSLQLELRFRSCLFWPPHPN